jgi:hypothetical protein
MRRRAIFPAVLALSLVLAGGAWAAAFPPKTLCFTTDYYGDQATFYIKSVGSVATADGTLKYYTINGEYVLSGWGSVPMAGTGHVDPNTGAFHYSVTGAFFDGYDIYSFAFEDYLDPSYDPPGYLVAYANASADGPYGWDDTYTPGNCTDVTIPYSAKKSLGAQKAQGVQKAPLSEALKARAAAFKAARGQSQP